MKKEAKEIKINDGYFKYYVYTPNILKYNTPLLLFLHGVGERGNNLSDIERYSLPNYLNDMEVPYIVIAPQCHDNNFWDYHLRDVEKVLEVEYKDLKYDRDNVFILGSSMGAFGAWNYIMQRPNIFKGIVSSAGGIMLPIIQNIDLIKEKPILIYHGDNDNVVDVSNSVNAYKKIKKRGATDIELKIIEGGTHYVASEAYKDEYLYKWLRKNIRKKK